MVFYLSYSFADVASPFATRKWEIEMRANLGRLLEERTIETVEVPGPGVSRRRSVTVNATESPLGWLYARKLICRRQYEAGERLRWDWERAQLAPRVTMAWDAAPVARGRGASGLGPDLTGSQLDAKSRLEDAVTAAGPGLSDILWRIVCAGEGMRAAEHALGWPARAGKVVLGLALDRVAAFYRLP